MAIIEEYEKCNPNDIVIIESQTYYKLGLDRDKEMGQVFYSSAQKSNGVHATPVSLHSSPNRGPTR